MNWIQISFVVVDSDLGKVGSFVPGTGQKFSHSSELETNPADVSLYQLNGEQRHL